jgi:hypothetical protein
MEKSECFVIRSSSRCKKRCTLFTEGVAYFEKEVLKASHSNSDAPVEIYVGKI